MTTLLLYIKCINLDIFNEILPQGGKVASGSKYKLKGPGFISGLDWHSHMHHMVESGIKKFKKFNCNIIM